MFLSCSDDRIGWYTHFQTAEKEEEEEEEEEEETKHTLASA